MAKESAASLGNDRTMLPGLQRSVPKSLGDQSTVGGLDTSAAIPDQGELEIVDLAKRYQIEGLLGQGGMGEVLLATDTRLKRKVAIKRVLGPLAQSKSALARFVTEAQSIAALSHPNVVQIYDYGRSSDGPFLIMEYVDGGTLLDQCAGGAIPLETAVELACQLCDGLGKAHDAGIVHRDIKPANVLMTKDGTAKLTDFGLAKIESGDNGMTMTGAVLGTVDFMPPEQRRDAALIDARSDLWSLAATLYQMVTGKSPKIIRLDQVPAALTKFLGKALEDTPDDRFQTAIEFREALRATLTKRDLQLADLTVGQCNQCNTINEAGRKYCRGCGGSLEITCLSCEAQLPIWEQYCGNCGSNQNDLVKERLAGLSERQADATRELNAYDYESAIAIATEIRDQSDPRLDQYKVWSEQFIADVQSQQTQQWERVNGLVDEALTHEAAFDYPAAVHALLQVPEPLRNVSTARWPDGIAAHLSSVKDKLSECKRLEQHISQCIAAKKLTGLLKEVESLHALRPDRADVITLKEKLVARKENLRAVSDQAYAEAQRLFAAQDYDACLKEFGKIDADFADSSIMKMIAEVQARRSRLSQLRQIISHAVANKEPEGLLPKVNEALDIKADAPDLRKLQEQLLKREERLSALNQIETRDKNKASRYWKQAIAATAAFFVLVGFIIVIGNVNRPDNWTSDSITNSIGMKLNLIPAGTFSMGSPASEADREDDETQHRVTLTKDFYLGTTEVTQAQWESVMGTTPWKKGYGYVQEGSNNAATYVSWDDAVEFCQKLSAKEGKTYCLPTESEWEYACRGGTTTAYSFGANPTQLSKYGWWGGIVGKGNAQTEKYAHPVGLKRANAFGLYDMHGNVYEWCSDWYGDYPTDNATDSQGARNGTRRVFRGGNWCFNARHCRSASRFSDKPGSRNDHLGFRVALSSAESGDAFAGPFDLSPLPAEYSSFPSKAESDGEKAPTSPLSSKNDSYRSKAGKVEGFSDKNDSYRSKVGEVEGFSDRKQSSLQAPPIPIAPFSENEAKAHQAAWAAYLNQPVELTSSIGMNLKLIPAGTFMMGSPESEEERRDNETLHRVTLTKPYYLGTTEVTQGQWESVMGTTPWKRQQQVQEGINNAATYVSWENAVEFCRKLSAMEGKTYRLPTEAEWEYACRAGTTTAYSFGDDAAQLSEYGWWGGIDGNGNSQAEQYAHAVGLKRANAFGLYDMHGNVWEWCSDWYGDYTASAQVDPLGAAPGSERVFRGGGWDHNVSGCRSSLRIWSAPGYRSYYLGFRVALSSVVEQ